VHGVLAAAAPAYPGELRFSVREHWCSGCARSPLQSSTDVHLRLSCLPYDALSTDIEGASLSMPVVTCRCMDRYLVPLRNECRCCTSAGMEYWYLMCDTGGSHVRLPRCAFTMFARDAAAPTSHSACRAARACLLACLGICSDPCKLCVISRRLTSGLTLCATLSCTTGL
jgi:hypothetical protein